MNSIELTAPAKVNLFLKVLNRRKDSCHNILTLFERISLADHIKISKIPKGIIVSCDKLVTRSPEDNIAYKAARLILESKNVRGGVRIVIKKRIPIAAGLGGGSSDAAAVLSGLNKLFGLGIDKADLMRLGAKLGADVPFFVLNAPFAVGKARGDRLEKADLKIKTWHLLIYPGFKVATKDVYEALDFALTRSRGGVKMTFPKTWNGLEKLLYNDLESAAVVKRPVIGKIIRCLASSLGKKAVLSGSGPSVFCLYRTRREAVGARRRLVGSMPAEARKGWQIFVVGTKMQ